MLMLNYGSGLKIEHTRKQFLKYLNFQLTGDCWCSPFFSSSSCWPVSVLALFWMLPNYSCELFALVQLCDRVHLFHHMTDFWLTWDSSHRVFCNCGEVRPLGLWMEPSRRHVLVRLWVYILSSCFAESLNFLKTGRKTAHSWSLWCFLWVYSEC